MNSATTCAIPFVLAHLDTPAFGPAERDAMMVASEKKRVAVCGAVLCGVEGRAVEIEVRLSSQLPRVDLVGLPQSAVRESTARVRSAITSLGVSFPDRRVTINLAPATLPKSGAGLDVAIAVGILLAAGHLDGEEAAKRRTAFVGELALDGRLRRVAGTLALVQALRDGGCERVIVPQENAEEAALVPKIESFGAGDLGALLAFLATGHGLERAAPPREREPETPTLDLADVRGQDRAKRALLIAATGGHTALLVGPPGAGKTMLAKRLPGILPPLPFEHALEVTQIHSAAGRLDGVGALLRARPFRAPHHSASRAGVLGGGTPPRPGEISLAHRGVLFLDEFPEFERGVRESLRQVLEDRRIVLARAQQSYVFPARFQLILAANPCPCGWSGSRYRPCHCTGNDQARYAARMSGPLLDRVDLVVEVPTVRWKDLAEGDATPESATARAQVIEARDFAAQRKAEPLEMGIENAEITDRDLDRAVSATSGARELLGAAAERLRLSARGIRRVLRVARSIADLGGQPEVDDDALAEALSYRREGREGPESGG